MGPPKSGPYSQKNHKSETHISGTQCISYSCPKTARLGTSPLEDDAPAANGGGGGDRGRNLIGGDDHGGGAAAVSEGECDTKQAWKRTDSGVRRLRT